MILNTTGCVQDHAALAKTKEFKFCFACGEKLEEVYVPRYERLLYELNLISKQGNLKAYEFYATTMYRKSPAWKRLHWLKENKFIAIMSSTSMSDPDKFVITPKGKELLQTVHNMAENLFQECAATRSFKL